MVVQHTHSYYPNAITDLVSTTNSVAVTTLTACLPPLCMIGNSHRHATHDHSHYLLTVDSTYYVIAPPINQSPLTACFPPACPCLLTMAV